MAETVNQKQSPEIEKEKNRVLTMVSEDKGRRDQETTFFRNSTLAQYTDVGIGQFIGHREKPEWKKDYQYNVFDPITRDKVMAILSKSAGLYESQFFNTNKRLAKFSELIATVLGAFYKDSTRRLKEKEKNKGIMLEALVKPKSIWFEGWRNQKRTIRDIEERDERGRITKTKEKKIVHYNGPWGESVPVEDIIPGSLKERDLQEQPRFSWVPKMQLDKFHRLFPTSRFPEASKVLPHGRLFEDDISVFTVRDDLKENEVEVVYFFEKWDDRLTIIANGVMLTPINSPMPFAHKDYPFVWGGFEELDSQFIYDMPLTIKLMDMQDMNNEILNLSLDMVWRALNEVVLVKSGDGINDDVLYGGGMVDVNDPQNFNKLEFGSAFGFNSASAMQDRARRSIESASLDAPQSGQSGARAITAREALIAREAALEITTLFLQNMENMERDKAIIRTKNQLDRYQRPHEWEKRIGKDLTEESVAMFREISVRDARLENGKRGTVNVNITKTPKTREELNEENVINDKELSQTINVTPEFIRQISFDVEVVANSSVKKSKAQEVAESRAFFTDALSAPQILDSESAARDYVEKLGKNPDDALVQKGASPQQEVAQTEGGKPPQPTKAESPDSIENLLNNAI
jgi:hypothetical protein